MTLRAPPPLATELQVAETGPGKWELRHGDKAVAVGQSIALALARIERASFEAAAEAEKATPIKPHDHALPTCFVCGPQRAPGDGLRLFAGPLARPTGPSTDPDNVVFATTWTPYPDLAAADGLVAPEFVWSALDCPTGYVSTHDPATGGLDPTPLLLGRLSARIDARPRPGERCVITTWQAGREGRKRTAEALLLGESGQILAQARAVWIAVDRQVQLGQS